jgi:hypothetical protein
MKNLIFLSTAITSLLIISCGKDDQLDTSLSPVGTWELMDYYSEANFEIESIGISGTATTELGNSDATIAINENGTLVWSGTCTILSTVDIAGQVQTEEMSFVHAEIENWVENETGMLILENDPNTQITYDENTLTMIVNAMPTGDVTEEFGSFLPDTIELTFEKI